MSPSLTQRKPTISTFKHLRLTFYRRSTEDVITELCVINGNDFWIFIYLFFIFAVASSAIQTACATGTRYDNLFTLPPLSRLPS